MIAAALLAAVQVQPVQPVPLVPVAPAPVPTPVAPPVTPGRAIDWSALPPLPWRASPRMTPPMQAFVAGEMARTACPMPIPVAGVQQVRVDVAVLIGAEGGVRTTIPRAIQCPVVEQYAAGLVVSFARGNLIARLVEEGRWYRASMLFDLPA